ncbi:MAG TPA: Crp/Fnr family transcriptional regulator [Thermoanaerobaculia bacterium]
MSSTGNYLLDQLPRAEADRLLPSLEAISLPHGYEIHRQDSPASHVYFPTSGMCSLVIRMEDGKVAEAATVGNEGMVGVQAILASDSSPATATSQVPGKALRVPLRNFLEAMTPGGSLDRLVRRYVAYNLRYANQTIGCNILHPTEERICRWLLMTHDRAGTDEFSLTHEFLAEMLGVRRQTVTVIAGTLQAAGLIQYRRGIVRILDREGLEAASCECYGVLRDLYGRIMG